MTRIMYDAIYAPNLPAGAGLYAGYVDGHWPSADAIAARFPGAAVVRIATSPTTADGVCLDVEQGDATPEEAVNWVLNRRHAGVDPSVYCSMSTWPAVRAAFTAHDVPQPHYWIAQYSPSTTIPPGAVAIQHTNTATYDVSSVADYWPGVDPAPTPAPTHQLEEDDMYLITAPRTAAPTSPKDVFMLQGSEYVHVPDTAKYEQLLRLGGKVGEVDHDTHAWLLAQFHGAAVVG